MKVFSRKDLITIGKTPEEIEEYTLARCQLWWHSVDNAKKKIMREISEQVSIHKVYSHIFDTMVVYILDSNCKPMCEYHHDDPIEGLRKCVSNITKKKRGRDIDDLCEDLRDVRIENSSKRRLVMRDEDIKSFVSTLNLNGD